MSCAVFFVLAESRQQLLSLTKLSNCSPCWVSGLCTSFTILNRNVSLETGSFSINK